MMSYINYTTFLLLLLFFVSCNKFLEEKPDAKLNTPSTNYDLQAILDNHSFLHPALLEISTDDYYVTDKNLNGITNLDFRNAYQWSDQPTDKSFWNNPYQTIFYCNTVLDYADKVNYFDGALDKNQIKGIAYFQRAFVYYSLVQVFCKYYDGKNGHELGLVLKLNSDINEKLQRSNLKDSYDQIIDDLKKAIDLLPDSNYEYPTRPNRMAAFAALARIYLGLGKYEEAKFYTEKALMINSKTIDFNQIFTDKPYPFPTYNLDIIYYSTIVPSSVLVESRAAIDTIFYQNYSDQDLRKKLFFKKNQDGTLAFTGNYHSFNQGLFCGLTVAELILNKAELLCRENNVKQAIVAIQAFLAYRYKQPPIIPSEKLELLNFLLAERRKELLFRGVRWTDIRRYISEGINISLSRKINGDFIKIQDKQITQFTYKIPIQTMERGGIEQNP